MESHKTGSTASNPTSRPSDSRQFSPDNQAVSPPPVPAIPPPVSPLSPATSDIIDRSTERQWSSKNNSRVMAAKVETTLRQWTTPLQRDVQGHPPQQDDNAATLETESRSSETREVRTVTPNYKIKTEKPGYEMKLGSSSNLPDPERVGDYKVRETQDHFKLQIIDPKVPSNADMPASSQTLPTTPRTKLDFPSEHSRRSMLNLQPLEQRRIRSVETRPITTSAYLTESLDRHREMEASRLKEYLKAKENEANKPWNKPNWPGPKPKDTEQSPDIEEIRKTIETLQKASNERAKKSTTDLEQLAEQGEILRKRSKGRRTDYKLIDSEIIKTAPEPLPAAFKEQMREMLESRVSNDTSANSTIPQQDRSGYITDVSSATWQFSTQSFSPRSVVSVNGAPKSDGLLKVRTDLSPNLRSETSRSNAAVQTTHVEEQKRWPYMPSMKPMGDSAQSTMTREYNESFTRHIDRYSSLPALDGGRGTLIKIKDDRPRPHGIMKSRELQTKDQMLYADQPKAIVKQDHWEQKEIKPKVTEVISKVEEHTRREEVERTRMRREKKEKKSRSGYRNGTSHEMVHGGYDTAGNYRYGGGSYRSYQPSHESYMRSSTTRREMRHGENDYYNEGGRHGSISDSLRRGEARYIPNGEIREVHHSSSRRNDGRMHKSYSTRDVFHSGGHDERRSSSNYYRGSQQNVPFVEFPPTLPRSEQEAPLPPPHRSRSASNDMYRPITKSRSYADWDDRRGFGPAPRRRDDEMMRIENEFRDSLLMPLPYVGGMSHKKERRHEQIPGGYESFYREEKSDSGHRFDKEGRPTQFNEASQEYSYKRETASDRRH